VIDLSTEPAGSYCARLLADFGADVVKIEPPEGDRLRMLPPLAGGSEEPVSIPFLYWNANKRSIVVDLETAAGVDRCMELCSRADVVVETFAPGRMAGLGLGFEELTTRNPGLVLMSVSPFGQNGPWKERAWGDLTAFALSGWAALNSTDEGVPLKGSGFQASYLAGLAAFVGVLGARRACRRFAPGRAHCDLRAEALTVSVHRYRLN
jgi:crotonobetainyl-CoA:carnitine CoA-transferase CaiB-like acyl-CoA transferase